MVNIAIAFMTFNGKVLLMHRDNIPNISNPNLWGLIGGHVEEGEAFEEALVREIKEESDVDITEYREIYKTIINRDNRDVEFRFYHVPLNQKQASDAKLMDEGQAVEFKTLDQLEKLDLSDSIKNFLEKKELLEKLKEMLKD